METLFPNLSKEEIKRILEIEAKLQKKYNHLHSILIQKASILHSQLRKSFNETFEIYKTQCIKEYSWLTSHSKPILYENREAIEILDKYKPLAEEKIKEWEECISSIQIESKHSSIMSNFNIESSIDIVNKCIQEEKSPLSNTFHSCMDRTYKSYMISNIDKIGKLIDDINKSNKENI